MPASPVEPVDLLDLKLLPAWVKEPAEERNYDYVESEEARGRDCRHPRGKRPAPNVQPASAVDGLRRGERPAFKSDKRDLPRQGKVGRDRRARRRIHDGHEQDRDRGPRPVSRTKDQHKPPVAPLEITVRFLPHSPAFDNVVAQIKSGSVAYSLFALARLFLEKPERYDVRLTAKAESPVYQLGENGAMSLDRDFLERNAFRFAREDFYKIDITQSDPIKGNFSNVARCRLSGMLLGPTNHHNYQPQLRSLYERRFSRRMSFAEYQRQIEIVNDQALIERWKDEARAVTTYTTLRDETPSTFASAAEAERHFRSNYLPGLVRSVEEITIGGALSRRLPDRGLNRAIEDAWTRETRSPSNTMQELAARFREAGLNVFRHRRGMLFVSTIRTRPFVHDHAGVSPSVNAILEALAPTPGINRKELAEKLIVDLSAEDAESRKLALASDLRWLISEGHVIEFNDGSLDLPRGRAKPAETSKAELEEELVGSTHSTPLRASSSRIPESAEIGGS
jgi:hypothetical protein